MIATGRIVIVAGQIGWNPISCAFETDDLVGQIDQALRNIVAVLAEAGAAPANVVRLTWFLTNRSEYLDARREIGRVYRERMGTHYPPMSVVFVTGLAEERAKVEIEATAVVRA
jgi:enamine deaminase RidA (YjgF/YER057c/UK114 family)